MWNVKLIYFLSYISHLSDENDCVITIRSQIGKRAAGCLLHFNVKNATSVPHSNVAYLPFTILTLKRMRSGEIPAPVTIRGKIAVSARITQHF